MELSGLSAGTLKSKRLKCVDLFAEPVEPVPQ